MVQTVGRVPAVPCEGNSSAIRLKGQGQVYGPCLANLAGQFWDIPDILFELVEASNVKLEHHPRWELRGDQRNGCGAPVRDQWSVIHHARRERGRA